VDRERSDGPRCYAESVATRTLTTREVRTFYDAFGARQDGQAFYEDRALAILIAGGGFGAARAVAEVGCGTGRLARRLLDEELPPEATYRGCDLSLTMARLAAARLRPFSGRARVVQGGDGCALPWPAASADRLVATYVLDILSEAEVGRFLDEAHRVLRPGGRLALAGITPGRGVVTRLVMGLWRWVHALAPSAVGGCRPQRVTPRLTADERWTLSFSGVVAAWGVASEVVVAARR